MLKMLRVYRPLDEKAKDSLLLWSGATFGYVYETSEPQRLGALVVAGELLAAIRDTAGEGAEGEGGTALLTDAQARVQLRLVAGALLRNYPDADMIKEVIGSGLGRGRRNPVFTPGECQACGRVLVRAHDLLVKIRDQKIGIAQASAAAGAVLLDYPDAAAIERLPEMESWTYNWLLFSAEDHRMRHEY